MARVIVLTEAEAERVRGRSPTDFWRALEPIPQTDGTYYLNPRVLLDPAHADVRDFLMSRRVEDFDPTKQYKPDDPITGEKGNWDQRPRTPTYDEAGVRRLNIRRVR